MTFRTDFVSNPTPTPIRRLNPRLTDNFHHGRRSSRQICQCRFPLRHAPVTDWVVESPFSSLVASWSLGLLWGMFYVTMQFRCAMTFIHTCDKTTITSTTRNKPQTTVGNHDYASDGSSRGGVLALLSNTEAPGGGGGICTKLIAEN